MCSRKYENLFFGEEAKEVTFFVSTFLFKKNNYKIRCYLILENIDNITYTLITIKVLTQLNESTEITLLALCVFAFL